MFGLREVEPMYTSQECSDCGYRLTEEERLSLSKRTFICPRCGLELDRDINASINILKRATLGLRESNAGGDDTTALEKAEASIVGETGTICHKEGRKLLIKAGSPRL